MLRSGSPMRLARGAGNLASIDEPNFYFIQHNVLVSVISKTRTAIEEFSDEESVLAAVATLVLVRNGLSRRRGSVEEASVASFLDRPRTGLSGKVDVEEITLALNEIQIPGRVFDPSQSRRSPSDVEYSY
jgi:hypothetical protein